MSSRIRTGLLASAILSSLLVVVPGPLSADAAPVWKGAIAEAEGALNSADLGDCSGAAAGGTSGKVWVARMPDDRVSVKVQIRDGVANETYAINVSCAGRIGTFETDRRGRGSVTLAPTDLYDLTTRTVIVIDIHLAAAPYNYPARATTMYLPRA